MSSYTQKKTQNPINALRITTYNTKHSKHIQMHFNKSEVLATTTKRQINIRYFIIYQIPKNHILYVLYLLYILYLYVFIWWYEYKIRRLTVQYHIHHAPFALLSEPRQRSERRAALARVPFFGKLFAKAFAKVFAKCIVSR